jgi:hypothetical protein
MRGEHHTTTEIMAGGGLLQYGGHAGVGMFRVKAGVRLLRQMQIGAQLDMTVEDDFGGGIVLNGVGGNKSHFYAGVFAGLYKSVGFTIGAQAGCVLYVSPSVALTGEAGLRVNRSLATSRYYGNLYPIAVGVVFALD